MTKLKHGPNRRTPLDRRPVRHRDQPPQVDLVDVLGLPPLRAKEPPVPRLRAQLADVALKTARARPRPQTLQAPDPSCPAAAFLSASQASAEGPGRFARPRTSVPRSPAL